MILYSESIASAFGDPPDSGVKVSARAAGDATSATSRPATMASSTTSRGVEERRGGKARGIIASVALELGRALLDEGHAALEEVLRASQRVLEVGLEVELLGEARVDHRVEGALRAGVRARRTMRKPLDERVRLVGELRIRVDAVDQAPVERLGGGDPLGEQRHLEGARLADAGRDEGRRAAIGHQADVREGELEEGRLGGEHEVAGERQRRADAGSGAVDRGDDRLAHRAQADDDRVVDAVEPPADVRHAVVGRLLEARLEICARREGTTGAGHQHGPDRVVRGLLDGRLEVEAELRVPRVERLGTVERDAPDATVLLPVDRLVAQRRLLSSLAWPAGQDGNRILARC